MIIIPSHAHLCGAKPTTGQSLWQTCSDFCYNWRFLSFFFIQLSSAARQCTIKLQWSCDRCCFFFFSFSWLLLTPPISISVAMQISDSCCFSVSNVFLFPGTFVKVSCKQGNRAAKENPETPKESKRTLKEPQKNPEPSTVRSDADIVLI